MLTFVFDPAFSLKQQCRFSKAYCKFANAEVSRKR